MLISTSATLRQLEFAFEGESLVFCSELATKSFTAAENCDKVRSITNGLALGKSIRRIHEIVVAKITPCLTLDQTVTASFAPVIITELSALGEEV